MRNLWVASLWLLLCSGWCLAQGPSGTFSPEKNRPSHPSDLMARSEMQAPRSIPITRRLRFEEIPVDVPSQAAIQDNPPSVVLQQAPPDSAVQNIEKAPAAVTVTGTPIITPEPAVEVNGTTGNSPQR